MIIDYDHNPNISYDQKLQSLKESVQMALNSETITRNDLKAILDEVLPLKTYVDMTEPMINLDTTASSGTDYDIYQSLTILGWDSDVIV